MEGVKAGNERLMGFGHRVYKNFDPRATIIKKACDDVFEVTGVNPLLAIAVELEKIALQDEYFVKRKLYPNVDFYSGLIYEALGMPADMFTVLFAIGRTPGWVAQWKEMLDDKDQKISRPRQIYVGRGRARLRGDRQPLVAGRRGGCRSAGPAPRRALRGRGAGGAVGDRVEQVHQPGELVVVQRVPQAQHQHPAAGHGLLGQVGALGGEVGVHHPAVARVGQPLHQAAALQPVHQLGDVGARHPELVAERVQAGAPLRLAAQHLEHLELRVREPKSPAWRSSSRPARAGHPLEGLRGAAGEVRAIRRIVDRFPVHHFGRYHPRAAGRQGAPGASLLP